MRSLYARPWTVSLLGAGLAALCVWAAAADAAAGPETSRPAATTAPAGATSAPARPAAAATSGPATAPTTAPAASTNRAASKLPLRGDRSQALPTLPDSGSGGVLGQMMAYVIVILLLGALAMVLAKRYLPRFQPAGGGRIRVVDNAYLGPRKQLHVVQIGSQRFLLASCRDSVTMISELASTFADALEASRAAPGTDTGTDTGAGTGSDASAGPADGEGRA